MDFLIFTGTYFLYYILTGLPQVMISRLFNQVHESDKWTWDPKIILDVAKFNQAWNTNERSPTHALSLTSTVLNSDNHWPVGGSLF